MNAPAEPTPAQQSAARLTAWAVDELPAAGEAEFQALIAADPALQAEAGAIRAFCGSLEYSLRVQPTSDLRLSPGGKDELTAVARQGNANSHRIPFLMPSLAAAACFAVMIGVFKYSNAERKAIPGVSKTETLPIPEAVGYDEAELKRLEELSVQQGLQGAFDKARGTLHQMLAMQPDNRFAKRLLKDLEEPDKFNAAIVLNPWADSNTAAVRLLMRTGLGYYDLGQFKEAEEQFNRVLALDPANTAARRQLEKTQSEVNSYYRAARDHTRIKMLSDVDSSWVTSVPGPAVQDAGGEFRYSVVYNYGEDTVPPADKIARQPSNESYRALPENPFLTVLEQPLSTFSIDVDTASYAIVRRHLNEGQRPPVEAVRLEEMINYFPMDDAPPVEGKPFAVHLETAAAPWAPQHRLVRVALKGRTVTAAERAPANLVFLVDTSGSMNQPNKLPLVQQSLQVLLGKLEPRDRVALVSYAGESRLVLPSTPLTERTTIAVAVDSLAAGGSTNGSGGITAAYEIARAHFIPGGVNRVILATDGDFNVGLTSEADLQTLIAKEAASGVYLSVLAYGSDNLKDTTAELLADKGNGNYAYIDSLSEARRALAGQLEGTLVTIAKDVKIQVEFNPAQVARYRLLGYENRALANQDFNDDTKDAGEIGAGHSVTALYEIVPARAAEAVSTSTGPLKYQTQAPAPAPANLTAEAATGELLTVKLRYQLPEGDAPSQLMEFPVKDPDTPLSESSANFRWTAAVAGYGLLLRGSAHAGNLTWETVRQLATAAKGPDADGFRGEFLQLIEKAAGQVPDKDKKD